MAEWVYKATPKKVSYEDTQDLLMRFKFLCRSAFNLESGRAPRVQEVALGDTIHGYFVRKDKTVALGSFRVIDGSDHPGRFSEPVAGTALVGVLETPQNEAMIAFLDRGHQRDFARGYERDPELGLFSGWAVKRLPGEAPRFNQPAMFPGPMTTLWRYPDPELPKVKKAARV